MRKSNTASQIRTIREFNDLNAAFVSNFISRKLALAALALRESINPQTKDIYTWPEIAKKLELASGSAADMLVRNHGRSNEKNS